MSLTLFASNDMASTPFTSDMLFIPNGSLMKNVMSGCFGFPVRNWYSIIGSTKILRMTFLPFVTKSFSLNSKSLTFPLG